MDKTVSLKLAFIILLVVVAVWTLYPPENTLKPGIDLAGGTSLIYEIDTQGLEENEKKDLAQRMITILRNRIDPGNIQNLVWRPLGNTRFEIQMPLTSADTMKKRQVYEDAMAELLDKNINPAVVLRSLQMPQQQRSETFAEIAADSNDRYNILENLAEIYDQRNQKQQERDSFHSQLKEIEDKITSAGLDLQNIKQNRNDWSALDDNQLKDALTKFTGSDENTQLLTEYTKIYSQWAKVTEELTTPETGINTKYQQAKRSIDQLNLTEEQMKFVLEMTPGTIERKLAMQKLKEQFEDRKDIVDKVVASYDQYRPSRGGLDDPKDLQRMLKGSGILEFRILPTLDIQTNPEMTDADLMPGYLERLKTKGPKYASDSKYVWLEVETEQQASDLQNHTKAVVAQFGQKYYVLASNNKEEGMLHSVSDQEWSLKKANPQVDNEGRRAIGFALDEKGGDLFWKITGENINRPLCIILDGIAISAPTIQSRIRTSGIITGKFSQTEINDMVNKLNAGSLPARLIEKPISVKSIGPAIGADNRDKGIKSGIIGLVVVIVFMIVFYVIAGSIADVALLLNILFVLAIMVLLRATFTLAGIAGMILTIGMSVDANILIYERIREEQQKGCSLRVAIKNGYQRAFTTILDSNLTTILTAVILYWVASEEIKGFAIVLILGIASSMFTALYVTRVIFDFLLSKKILKDHLFMLQVLRNVNIDWMRLRPVFLTGSAILIIAGLFVFFTRDEAKNSKYDIEFTGGTSVQIDLTQPKSRQYIEDKIRQIGIETGNSNLSAANVYRVGESDTKYEITTTETNKTKTIITISDSAPAVASVTSAIQKAQQKLGENLNNLVVTQQKNPAKFQISTSRLNKSIVKQVLGEAFPDVNIPELEFDEVVNNAVTNAFGDILKIKHNLKPRITAQEKLTDEIIDKHPELMDFLGGFKITCEIEKPDNIDDIRNRFKDLRFKPDTQNLNWSYPYKIMPPDMSADSNEPLHAFTYISVDPEAAYRELTEDQWKQFADNETTKILAAASLETSLPQVTQIDPSVGDEAKTRALIAIILSLFALIVYIWVRFGNVRYGLGAVFSLAHDVCVTLGAVTVCTYIASTPIGRMLLIGDFKIDLTIIAAFLTLIGYSLNDTIVVFDRIRENRQTAQLTARTINTSINQTLSRTLLTGVTTFAVILIMYIFGGPNLRGFNFTMGFGIIIGTYSSIAIAVPIILIGSSAGKSEKNK